MIIDGKKWPCLAITNLSALLQGKSSNYYGDFYCLNCFNSYTLKNKLKKHEEICNNHDSCHIEMPKWAEKILYFNPGEKSLKALFAIYLDLECLLKNMNLLKIIIMIIIIIITTTIIIIILKNLTQGKKLDMSLLVGQCLQDVYLIKKKINLIITEEKIILKNYVES